MESSGNDFEAAILRGGQEFALVHAESEIERSVQQQNGPRIRSETGTKLSAENFTHPLRTAAHVKSWRNQRLCFLRRIYNLKKCSAGPVEPVLRHFVHRQSQQAIGSGVPAARFNRGAGDNHTGGLLGMSRAEFHGDVSAQRKSHDERAACSFPVKLFGNSRYGVFQAKWHIFERAM